MTTKQKWLDLAERCEKAMRSDREIDVAIEIAAPIGSGHSYGHRPGSHEGTVIAQYYGRNGEKKSHGTYVAPNFTFSLDAITALIKRELPEYGHGYSVFHPTEKQAVAHVANDDDDPYGATAATPALALCAAFCRAMAGKAGT